MIRFVFKRISVYKLEVRAHAQTMEVVMVLEAGKRQSIGNSTKITDRSNDVEGVGSLKEDLSEQSSMDGHVFH